MLLLVVLFGILVGVVCGLTPGIHTNLIAVVVAALPFDPFLVCVFLVCVAVTNSVVDAVPSVFLGASEDVMALLPGHQLLVQGLGVDAVKFTVMGSLFGMVFAVFLIPVFVFVFPFLFSLIRPFLFWIILVLVLFLLFKDRSVWSFVVFVLAGVFGLIVFRGVKEPLFPMLSGLFGGSGLLLSLKTSIPKQESSGSLVLSKWDFVRNTFYGVLSGSIVTLFPGLGPSQGAALLPVKKSGVGYLVLVGAMGTVDVVISFVTWFVLNRARNGAVVILKQIIGSLSFDLFLFVLGCVLLSVGVASVFSVFIAKVYAGLFEKINYAFLCLFVLFFLCFLVVLISGFLGLLVFVVACFIGMLAPLSGVSRANAMGCLIVPLLFALS
ncbi:hypothetical protein DRJ22_04280 [Candidatus Woesearchaeota archaeon]|nr:MAG: hypothetical protein B6U93_03760 [Candidatus Woesearchaeota archaeon ex4484_78]RLE45479.1 MAG: hypothetical protein DRJ22_04280 [Candidatus Woesearchaeota archaeon]